MTKTLVALAAAATVAVAAIAAPTPAEARWRGGGPLAAGVIGGLALGALAGSAIAGPRYYAPAPVYYDGPPCQWRHERVWDGYGWIVRRVRVCY